LSNFSSFSSLCPVSFGEINLLYLAISISIRTVMKEFEWSNGLSEFAGRPTRIFICLYQAIDQLITSHHQICV
jgi:hypothetical protein